MTDTDTAPLPATTDDAEKPAAWRRILPPRWRVPAPVVGVIRFSGAIGAASPLRQGLSLATTAKQIDKAFSLNRLKAVALLINSPGGSPVQSTLIMRRIRQLAAEKEVPVVAFCEDVAASGGYLLALAGDEIFADASSIVGSIGVIAAGFGFNEAIARLGIDRRVYTAGEDKLILDPFQPEKESDVEKLKALQAEIHETFKSIVRERRGAAIEGREGELFTGRFWTGTRAAELGLIDGLADIRSLMRERYGDKVRLELVSGERSWFRRRTGVGGAAEALLDATPGPSLAGDIIGAIEERALWSRYGL